MLASEENVKDITRILDFFTTLDNGSQRRHTQMLLPLIENTRMLLDKLKVEVDFRIQLQSLQMRGFEVNNLIFGDYPSYDTMVTTLTEVVANAKKMESMRQEFNSYRNKIPDKTRVRLEELFKYPTRYQELSRLWSKVLDRVKQEAR